MKNVMRKVFSLFLVGVVAVSMFGFVAPTRAEAVGCAGELCLEWYDKENYGTIDIYIYFLDSYGDNLKTFKAEKVKKHYNGWVMEFPMGTTSVAFEVYGRSSKKCILCHEMELEDFTSPDTVICAKMFSVNKNGNTEIDIKSEVKK